MTKDVSTAPKSMHCKFNDGVHCEEQYSAKCARCGWNPEVAKKRIESKCYVRKEADK